MDEQGGYHACDLCDCLMADEWHECDTCGNWHRPPTEAEEAAQDEVVNALVAESYEYEDENDDEDAWEQAHADY